MLIGHSLGAQAQPSLVFMKRCGVAQWFKCSHGLMSSQQVLAQASFMRLWLLLAYAAAVDVTKFRTCHLATKM